MSTTRQEALGRGAEWIEAAAWRDARAAAAPATALALGLEVHARDDATVFLARRVDSLLHNRVLGLGLAGPMAAETPRRLQADYAGVPGGFAVNLSPLAPPAVAAALSAAGYATWFHHLKHVRATAAAAPGAPGWRVAPLSAADGAVWAALAAPAGEGPAALREWSLGTLGRAGWTHFLASEGDTPAAVAALFVQGEWGWVGWAHTLPAHRGRGAQRALLAERVRAAHAQGARWLTTETGPDWEEVPRAALDNVRAAGFTTLYERPSWIAAG
jgi:GNAT superfamily N-acetyltransferase